MNNIEMHWKLILYEIRRRLKNVDVNFEKSNKISLFP